MPVYAENWFTFTLDNDLFIGRDDGYTNGVYFSLHNAGLAKEAPEPGLLISPLAFLFEKKAPLFSLNSWTFGQTMVTPEDITAENPDPRDVPYSGLIFLSNSFIRAWENEASKYTFAFGMVGPSSLAEESQRIVHKTIGSEIPQGWDYQLKDEFVFQLEYGRMWRRWLLEDRADLILLADLALGTIETFASSGTFVRFGNDLEYTYVTPSLRATRTVNPIAIDGGWFVFAGFNAHLYARRIFVDGNTFKESRSTELDHTQFSFAAGFTFSWKRLSASIAMENAHILEDSPDAVSRYGSLTLAWKY